MTSKLVIGSAEWREKAEKVLSLSFIMIVDEEGDQTNRSIHAIKVKQNTKNTKYSEVNVKPFNALGTAVLSVVDLNDIEEYIAEINKQKHIWRDVITD